MADKKYISKIQYGTTEYLIKAASLQSLDGRGDPIATGKIPSADGSGGLNWDNPISGVQSVGGLTGIVTAGVGIRADNDANTLSCIGMSYESSLPSQDFLSGGYRVAILDAEPSDTSAYKKGWLYFILE